MSTLASNELALNESVFASVAAWLKETSGMHLSADKTYLLETRLYPIALTHGYENVHNLLQALHAGTLRPDTKSAIIDAMTTNESLFFRDSKPFDALIHTMLPALRARGDTNIRVWSAACSFGQELYSIAMRIAENPQACTGMQIELSGSDIASHAVTRAKRGVFSQFEVQRGLPITHVLKYFTQNDPQQWQVSPNIMRMARFFIHNLLDTPPNAPYHIIFCRYVLIYFDEATRKNVLKTLASALAPGGYLVLGCSEAIRLDVELGLQPIEQCPGAFVKIGNA